MSSDLATLVSLTGLGVAGIGLLGVVAPTELTRLLRRFRFAVGLPVTFALRIVFGSIFVMAAPDCRLPGLVCLVGLLEFAGAAVLLGVGAGRLDRFAQWWLERPPSFVRRWCLAAFGFGSVILYAGA